MQCAPNAYPWLRQAARPEPNHLGGTLTEIVYRGTDTFYHFDLADGTPMRARRQNATVGPDTLTIGDKIDWWCAPDAISVLPEAASSVVPDANA